MCTPVVITARIQTTQLSRFTNKRTCHTDVVSYGDTDNRPSLFFCRAMLCISAAYAVMRCLSVREFCQNE